MMPAPLSFKTSRWTPLKSHPVQHAYWNSPHRFNLVSAGRRSGKTELAKRKLIKKAMRGTRFDGARFFAAAPTRDQAQRIYWGDLKRLIHPYLLAKPPSESKLEINLINGTEIVVLGMDKPERIEGSPWDGGILDEYGNMKKSAWDANVRPALADRRGWCDLIGVPEGRNHYFDFWERAGAEIAEFGAQSETGRFTWHSADILSAEEIIAAKRNMHPRLYQQEYEGSFVDWSGIQFFELDKLLDADGAPLGFPARCDSVWATIDSATKTGAEHDGTGVIYWAYARFPEPRLYILDWDLTQIEGSLLEVWLPTVFQNLEVMARETGALMGSLGAFIEDKNSGSVLIQQARRREWPAQAIDSALTAMGKDERALSTSGYHYRGSIKVTDRAYNKVKVYKDSSKNHLINQIVGFRLGDPDANKREDDLLDCYTYGIIIGLGNEEGF